MKFRGNGEYKLKKTIVSMTTIALVGLGSVIFGNSAHAETIGNLESQQSQLKDDRSSVKENLSKAEAKIADVLIDLEDLNTEIDRVKKALKENQNKLSETENEITKKEDEVTALEEDVQKLEDAIEKRFDILKERIVSYQKGGGNISYLEVVFGSKNFGDFISRVSAVNKITDSDTALIEQQEKDKAEVEEIQEEVQTKLDELNDQKEDLEGLNVLIEEQKQENEKRKDQLKAKENDLVTLKSDLEIKDSKLASLETKVRQDLENARRPVEPVVATASEESHSNKGSKASSNDNGNLTQVKSKTSKKSNSKTNTASAATVTSNGGGLSTVINAGFAHTGTPYVWGGKGPGGFDCSGFVSWAFGQGGYSIPSNTSALAGTGTKVSSSNMQPGDIVFFNTYKTNGHVGIYLGGGNFIGAQNSTGLAVANMSSGYWKDHFAGHVRRVN